MHILLIIVLLLAFPFLARALGRVISVVFWLILLVLALGLVGSLIH